MSHRMDPDLTVVEVEHLQRLPDIGCKYFWNGLRDGIFHVAQACHGTEAKFGGMLHPVTQKRGKDKQGCQREQGQPDHCVPTCPFGLVMEPEQDECRDHDKWQDPDGTVAV